LAKIAAPKQDGPGGLQLFDWFTNGRRADAQTQEYHTGAQVNDAALTK
jgi:hypothetical protein